MRRYSTALPAILLVFAFGQARAGQAVGADEPDAPRDGDQTPQTDTELGPFSIGVTDISENARLKTLSGNVELGYLYEHTFDATFPRVLVLRPFLFNRASTTETSYYESLGVGAGIGLSLRKQYEQNNWFVRVSMLTPSDHYRAQLDLNRDQTAIFDLFAGYEIPLGVTDRGRELRERTTSPGLIQLRVPAWLLQAGHGIEADTLAQVHTLMVAAYLAEVSRLQGTPPAPRRQARADWPVIRLIARVTGRRLSAMQWRVLSDDTDVAADSGDERIERRRRIVADFVKRGLTEMMRGSYPLLIKPVEMSATRGVAAGRPAKTVAFISRPGTRVRPSDRPMDADTMIEHYIASLLSHID